MRPHLAVGVRFAFAFQPFPEFMRLPFDVRTIPSRRYWTPCLRPFETAHAIPYLLSRLSVTMSAHHLTLTGLKSRDSREVDSLGTPEGFRGLPCWTGYPRLSAGSGKVFDHDVESRSASVRMFKAAFTSLS